ncbi:amino acid oxidase [Micrococcus luteus]|uniref:amino acid oxidase n=1 Tax=Micrococcus luteus TaxID=1270 RepID=UPI0038797741
MATAVAAPAFAISPSTAGAEYGLFVTTGRNNSEVGYDGTDNTGQIRPATPPAYFAAVAAGNNPESDINWNDGSQCYTNSQLFRNGEGSFTPVTNSGSGKDGSYVPSSGFWWSVPTRTPESGDGYVPGSTATLRKGATFTTLVEIVLPPSASWTADNITVLGRRWTGAQSGKRVTTQATTATHLANQMVAGDWSITAPQKTTLADGSIKVTGTVTFKTTQDYTVRQSGNVYYGQVEFMPSNIYVYPGYGWTSFSLTSQVTSATIAYTGQPVGMDPTLTLSNALVTTSTVQNRAC